VGGCNGWYFGYLVDVQTIESNHQHVKVGRWKFFDLKCDVCKTSKLVRVDVVRRLDKQSKPWRCNHCVASEWLFKLSTRHGKYGSGSYRSWIKMKDRCLNPAHVYSKYYRLKGVTICEKWLSFEGFYEDMGDRPDGYSLDRIDNNLGYFKDNCRWIPLRDQPKNRLICKKKYVPELGKAW
jgi:hypothetical protein